LALAKLVALYKPWPRLDFLRKLVIRATDVSISPDGFVDGDLDDYEKADVLDVAGWRKIQRVGDIRNLCDHNKHREPTEDEAIELIDGVDKLSKTLF
jgi:hypothetical protein